MPGIQLKIVTKFPQRVNREPACDDHIPVIKKILRRRHNIAALRRLAQR
jgi:hypothetical protein